MLTLKCFLAPIRLRDRSGSSRRGQLPSGERAQQESLLFGFLPFQDICSRLVRPVKFFYYSILAKTKYFVWLVVWSVGAGWLVDNLARIFLSFFIDEGIGPDLNRELANMLAPLASHSYLYCWKIFSSLLRRGWMPPALNSLLIAA